VPVEFLQYFGGVFEPVSFLLLLGGTIGGLILGATPGLSPTMAVALLIPFTFQLAPTQGLILLGAAYTSTVAGGAVSAILLKIPGAPANIATALDGHEMARRGEGARALHLSFMASGIGGVTGVLLLIFLTPVLAQWALAFGPPHLFWMAILGVTVIGSLDSNSFVKGLLSGCLGLWLSMIGYDDIQGAQRFIFHDALTGGVNIITALIGIFAIPQVINMFAKGRVHSAIDAVAVNHQSIASSASELTTHGKPLAIGTVVGSVIGLIPGVGGQIAGLLAYDQTRKFSRNRERFGQGEPAGVIAAESANNAMVGPSLVPLLTLSIPGSPTAAVLLGGLLIHGIFPGSDLFENHPDVAWTFINSMLIGQVLMVFFGIWVASYAARVAKIPSSIMAAAVLVLALFGAYSVQQSMGDVHVMVILGIAMYVLEKFGFSAAPLVLGLILGPIAEANFIQGSMIAAAVDGPWDYFFTGSLNITLITLVVASILWSFFTSGKTAPAVGTPSQLAKPQQEAS
jgi:putative tricarboxylic transport membrane protein